MAALLRRAIVVGCLSTAAMVVDGAILDIREGPCSGTKPSCANCCGLACCAPGQDCDEAKGRCVDPTLPPAITVAPTISIGSWNPPCVINGQSEICTPNYEIFGHGFSDGQVYITIVDVAEGWLRWYETVSSDFVGGSNGATILVETPYPNCEDDASAPDVKQVLVQAVDFRSGLKSNVEEVPIFCNVV